MNKFICKKAFDDMDNRFTTTVTGKNTEPEDFFNLVGKVNDAETERAMYGAGGLFGGAGLGAAAGYFIDRRNRLRGLLIGGAIGGLSGGIIGGTIGNVKANNKILAAHKGFATD